MARALDAAPPAVTGPRPPPIPGWAAELFIAIERLPTAGYAWDDYTAGWDLAGFVWDDTGDGAGMTDATCDFTGVEIEAGLFDVEGRIEAGHALVTLLNEFGQWSQWDAFGRLVNHEPGSRLDIWARMDGEPWWLFSGTITAWREQADGMVEVEAFDGSSQLNLGPGGEWEPGIAGELPAARIAGIAALGGWDGPMRLDPGRVTLHNYTTTATPLEEMQSVATSDGGMVGWDADGALIYRDRSWPAGRPDQTTTRVFSDNVCTVEAVVWDLELVTDDEFTATTVRLENVEGLGAVAIATGLANVRYDRTGDQWRTLTEGTELADAIVERRANQYLRIDGFALYLHDPLQDLWAAGIDLRLGDVLRFVRDQVAVDGQRSRLDLDLIVGTVRHQITPDAWIVQVATTPAVGNNITFRWGGPGAIWDQPPAVWGF